MQTFLPYPDFKQSAQSLDNKRLGKQRVEVLQLSRGQFPNHPASKMWRHHEFQLCEYGLVICQEWIDRGFQDTCYGKIKIEQMNFTDSGLPRWFGNEEFHMRHRSRLLTKDFEFYHPKFPNDVPGLEYLWSLPDAN